MKISSLKINKINTVLTKKNLLMTKIVVINDSPSDVFSTHLLGKNSLEVIRMRLLDNEVLNQSDLILTVNYRLALAEKFKQTHPDVRVIAVFGGQKDSQAVATVVYGPNDYDYFNYGAGWKEFDDILFNEKPRQPKYLIHKRDESLQTHFDRELSVYRPNLSLLNTFSTVKDRGEFSDFLSSSISLSLSYLNWYKNWIIGARKILIPLSSRPKKKASQLEISFVNYFDGLPIFSCGDSVILLGKHDNEIYLEDNEEDSIKVSIIQSASEGVTIKFSAPVNAGQLLDVYKIKLDAGILSNRISFMAANVNFLLAESSDPQNISVEMSWPAYSLIRTSFLSGYRERIDYPSEVILNSLTRKILRDQSQIIALLDMLSDKPVSWVTGPPGTGKTFTAAAAVDNFVRRGANVLLVSHSNLGVDNLLAEVANHVDHNRICRIGNDLETIDERVRKFHRGLITIYNKPNYLGDFETRRENSTDSQMGRVTACTIDGFLTFKCFRGGIYKPDVIICDEASRGLFPEKAPLILAAETKIIFIGDNKQLGSVPIPLPVTEYLKMGYSEKALNWFSGGFFNSVVNNQYLLMSPLLTNRRSLPRIVEIVNIFYDGRLIPGRFNPHSEGEVIFLDTKDIEASEKKDGTSWLNHCEVNIVAKRFLSQMIKHVKAGGKINDSVIITPYKPQEKALKQKLRNHLLYHDAFVGQTSPQNIDDILEKAVITVDAIQGGERKFVSISFVRSNDRQDIGFNKDIRRINVAMSRAQESLIIICNSQTFIKCEHEAIVSAFLQILQVTKKYHRYFVLK